MTAVVGTPFYICICLHVDQASVCLMLCVLQDEVDSQNPVLRDNHQLHEEVKSWLKDQKVQEIFMQGKLFVGSLCCVIVAA